MSVADLAALKVTLNITGTTSDTLLQRLLDSTIFTVEKHTDLNFTLMPALATDLPVAVAVALDGGRPVVVPHARTITSVEVIPTDPAAAPVALTADQYRVTIDPRLRAPYVWEIEPRRNLTVAGRDGWQPSLRITGRFGVTEMPADIVDAVLTMAARRYREKDALYGDVVQLQDGAVATYFRQFPVSVQTTISSYAELAR